MTEREIFAAALHISDSNERVAFLDQICAGDAAMRERVEALLAEHEQLGSFMEVSSQGATRDILTERPGTQVGPYKLLEQIGEGGMGVVYLADQLEPVQRQVAIKLMKEYGASLSHIARFFATLIGSPLLKCVTLRFSAIQA
jgi:serine/threonine protein kinase